MKKLLATIGLLIGLTSPAWALFCPSNVSTLSPNACYPLQELSGTTITDTVAAQDGIISGDYILNQNGGIDCQGQSGTGCNISFTTTYASPQPASFYFSFAGTSGGIFQLGNASSLSAFPYYLGYLDNHGKLTIGVNNNGIQVIVQSPLSYADGNQHRAVVTVGPSYGTSLYVDGQKVASTGNTFANYATGSLFLGGVNTAGWQLSPSDSHFNGTYYTFAYWNDRELTPTQGISATGGNPSAITNNYCTFSNQIASLDPNAGQAYASKKLTFTLNPNQLQVPGLGSTLPIGPSNIVCTTDTQGNINAGCQVPQGAHVNLSVGNGPPIPLVIPASTSCDLVAVMLSQTDPPEVVSAVAVAGPLFAGTTVTNPPAGTIGTATITAPAAFSQTQSTTANVNIGTNGNVQQVILSGNATVNLTNFSSGANFIIDTTENGTGGFSPTFTVPAGWTLQWPGAGSQPGLPSTVANAHNVWQFIAISATQLVGNISTISTGTFPLSATGNFNNYSGTNVNTIQMGTYLAPTPTVTSTCSGTCATTYTYEITCLGDASTHSGPSSTQTATNAATLDGSHYNTVTWSAGTGCYGGYNVYGRIGGALGLIGTTTNLTFTDNSMAAPGAAPPTSSTMGAVIGDLIGNTRTLTTLGDILYENSTPVNARLAGNTAQLATPTFGNSNVTNIGTTGSTTYTYYVVCNDSFGGKTLVSASGATSTGNASLTSSNYNVIALPSELGCVSWDVLKTDTAHSLALAQTGPTVNDQGGATSAYTTPVANTTAVPKLLNSTPNTSNVAQAPTWSQNPPYNVAGFDNVTATGIPSNGQVLTASSATAATWSLPNLRKANTQTGDTLVTFGPSSAGGTVYSFTLPGGSLGTDGQLACSFAGTFVNNTGGPDGPAFTLTYGSVTGILLPSTTVTANASASHWRLTFTMTALGVTNSEYIESTEVWGPAGGGNANSGTTTDYQPGKIVVDDSVDHTVALVESQTNGVNTTFKAYWGECKITAP